MTLIPPTKRQLDCLHIIIEMIDGFGVSPSHKELANELCLASTGAVNRLIHGLESRGWISVGRGRQRAISILHRPKPLDFDITFVLGSAA